MTQINMKQAVIYCRVSTWGQAKTNSLSLQIQIRECMEYCEELGIEVKAIFTDIHSAYKPHLLHGRRQALRMCRANKCRLCVSWGDRFSRIHNDAKPTYGMLVVNGIDWFAMPDHASQEACA
jgi:DNA invertase Pin-like site-specific DNA recombinase